MTDAYYLLTAKELEEVSRILTDGGFDKCLARFTPQEIGFYFGGELPCNEEVDKAPVAVASIRDEFNHGNESHLKMVFACSDAKLQIPETRIYVDGKALEDLLKLPDSKALAILKETEPYAVYDPSTCGLDTEMLERIQNYKPKKS